MKSKTLLLLATLTLTSCQNQNNDNHNMENKELLEDVPPASLFTIMRVNMQDLRNDLQLDDRQRFLAYFNFPLNAERQFDNLLYDEYAEPRIKKAGGVIDEKLFKECLQNSNNLIVAISDLETALTAFNIETTTGNEFSATGVNHKAGESWTASATIQDSTLTILFNGGMPLPENLRPTKNGNQELISSEFSMGWNFRLNPQINKLVFVEVISAG